MNALTEYRQAALVKPSTDILRAARITVSCSPEVQGLFEQAAAERWDTGTLSRALAETLPAYMLDEQGIPEVAQYLAEEFALRDKDQTLLVSALTGEAVGQVPPDAFYQPGPVEREFTEQLAVPLMRLKPEVEAAIIQHHADRGRDARVLRTLSIRARSTELQKQEGDHRLLVSTSNGRKKLQDRIKREVSELLTGGPGMVGEFLSLCTVGAPQDAPGVTHQLRITAHASVPLTDMLTLNLQHDPYVALKEQIRAQWARNIARQAALFAYCQLSEVETRLEEAPVEGLMVCDPDTAIALKGRPCLVVDGVPSVVLSKGPFLGIEDGSYVCEAIERQGRWEVAAGFDVALHLDLTAIQTLRFIDVPVSGLSVEVV